MRDPAQVFTAQWLLEAFPPERTSDFFEALFGDAEDGAYNIELVFSGATGGGELEFAFNLRQRGDQCLACNLTSGLPRVFDRHPIINAAGIAAKAAETLGSKLVRWEIGKTRQLSTALHVVPFYVWVE